ncbi:hypothetical protein JKF63_01650 [Porcisia hertigi]|uniref:Uncharacterized protein n=1 Tax=Porcisia hertigi TaxID=2761500 RepID=A0A836I5C6_9TRYP|nr:hypothetical protein JKF63_01650 [Porcisia hertigi]
MSESAAPHESFWDQHRQQQQQQQQPMQVTQGALGAMQNNNIQLLQMRVETLERQVAMLSAQIMTIVLNKPFQDYSGVTYGMSPPASSVSPPSAMPPQMPANMYYFQPPDMPSAAPVNSAPVDHSKPSKQLEDELQRMGVLTYHGAAAGNKADCEAAVAAANISLIHNNAMTSPTSGNTAFPSVISGVSSPNNVAAGMSFMTGQHEVALTPQSMLMPPTSSPTNISNTLLQKAFGFSDPFTSGAGSDGMNVNMNNLQRSCAVTLDPVQSTNETLEQACQQTKIRVLCLKSCKGITNLKAIARLQNLWLLNLQGCSHGVDDNAVRMIATHNTRLSRLNLCGCDRVTDAKPLAQLFFMFDLNLSGTMIGNASLEAISRGCCQLSRLAINSCQHLTDVSSVKNLSELKLLYCRYSENIDPSTIASVLTGIGKNLLTLNADGIRFRQLDLSLLPHATALKNFNCKDNTQLENLDWMLSIPNAATTFESLEMLDVEGCESLTNLGTHITSLKKLKTMRLSNTGITNEELARISACPALAAIHLEGCAGITNVECLAKVPSLTKVILDVRMQHEDTKTNGVAALRQKPGVDVIFSAASTHHGQGGLNHRMNTTPTATPTSRFAPSIPTVGPNTVAEAFAFS